MNRPANFLLLTVLIAAATTGAFAGATTPTTPASTNTPPTIKLPRLVDLGADKCIPCKKMAPILSELKSNYVGQLEVEFIDVWKNPDAAKPYKLRLIPTQIFYDATGKELFRHEGFYGKADILAKWQELGVNLKSPK
jgi:thioredoxin 1